MTLETFFAKFDQFAGPPDAVAKMRELVLDLAVQGKLFGAGAQIGADGIPTGWHLRQLGQVAQFINGDRSKNYPSKSFRVDEGIPFINAGHLLGGDVDPSGLDYITPEHFERLGGGKVEHGDVLYCLRGSLGKCAVVQSIERGAIASSLVIIRPSEQVTSRFIYLFLTSPLGTKMIAKYDNGSAQPNLSAANVKRYVVPIPPVAEQKRIVAKVDELMALCDRLEAQQQEREARHAVLARAALAQFAEAPTAASLQLLFHPSYAISPADLRKTILTLAVQGELVPQDPNDQGADRALRACGVDMKRWFVTKAEERQHVPDSWTWIRFAGVGEQRLGKMLDAQKNRGESKPYLRNTNVQWMRFELDGVKEMRVEAREEDELRLKRGDLLICEGGEPGRCAIWSDEVSEMYFQKALHRVRPCGAILSEYLALNLQVDCGNGVLDRHFTGATIKHLTGRSLSLYPIPIPPPAEQRRIVAKVDQLMALVDELESQLTASRATAANLLSAAVAELTSPELSA